MVHTDSSLWTPRKHTVKPLFNIAAAAVTMAQQNTVYVGVLHRFRTPFLFLTLIFAVHNRDGFTFKPWGK